MSAVTVRPATETEIANWDENVIANPLGGNMLQSEAFADVKSRHGWAVRHIVLTGNDPEPWESYNLVFERRLPGFGRLWYVCKGPDVADVETLIDACEALKDYVREHERNVFAITIEPDILDSESRRGLLNRAGLERTFNIQANDHTAVLDVTPEPRALLRRLHSRGRNAIRRAERDGVVVEQMPANEQTYKQMFAMMHQVGQGVGNIPLRSYEYYRRFWQNFIDRGQGRMYFVHEDGAPSVGAFVVKFGKKGTYKDGGSTPRRKAQGDSHLVQWTAIKDLREEGIETYDLCGTPPSDQLKDKDHKYYGLGLFKTSFTKTVIDYLGCWDIIVRPGPYRAWRTIGEKVYRTLWVKRHKQPYY